MTHDDALLAERHVDHTKAVGHLVIDSPRYSLLASSDVGFLAAAGRELLARMGAGCN